MGKAREVYIVVGQRGEYSDHREWFVAAYTDKAKAELHADRAKEHAHRQWERLRENDYDADFEPKAGPIDPSEQAGGFGYEPDYFVATVQLLNEVPS